MPRVCPKIQSCQFIFIPSFIFSLWKLNLIYFLFLGIMNIRIKEFGINFHRDGKIPHHCGFLVSHSAWFLSKFLDSNLLPGHQRLSIVATKPRSLVTTDFYSLLFHNSIITLKKDTNNFKN